MILSKHLSIFILSTYKQIRLLVPTTASACDFSFEKMMKEKSEGVPVLFLRSVSHVPPLFKQKKGPAIQE